MATTTRIIDYLGEGTAASRPASLNLATGALGLYYATDSKALSVWNGTGWDTPVGPGTVTQIVAGSGLAGGTITGTGTLSLGTVAAGHLLANTGTAAAVPADTSLSALLDDVFGTTQGAGVLYRDVGGWQVLAPGTAGQVLETGGSGADPFWAPSLYAISGFAPGTMSASQLLLMHRFSKPVTFQQNFAAALSGGVSGLDATAVATAAVSLAVNKCPAGSSTAVPANWTQVGTISIAAGAATATFATTGTGTLTFAAGDKLQVVGPSSPDATLANIALTLSGDR